MKISLALLTFLALAAFAQQPSIKNARLESHSAASGLEPAFQQSAANRNTPAWIGYSVPIVKGDHSMCCYNGLHGCSLESKTGDDGVSVSSTAPVNLEGPDHLVVLYRVENGNVGKIRTFTPECTLDAGGLPFIWLTDVKPAESIAFLAGLAKQSSDERQARRRSDSAIAALALHADLAADASLEQLAAAGNPEWVRRPAIFWMGEARGRRGYEMLSRTVREDPADRIREHAVFALTQSKDPAAISDIIRVAHEDKSTHVRGQALFWLAQRAAAKTAASAIQDAIANDPETDVKKKAVFALSQMRDGEGVPLLIQVARENRNSEVRKQAVFWLGQSKDPRALAFIEDVLKP
jgi:hypothetical protein